MDNPENCVPYQYTSNKNITQNDIITTETAPLLELSGQVLRTIGFKK